MNDLDFSMKVKNVNSQVNMKDLAMVLKSFPINQIRSLENLDVVLTQESIRNCDDANQLIILIEKESRHLDCKSANLKKAEIENQVREFEELKRRDNELFIKILESQGLIGESQNLECAGCGLVVTASGICKC